tara:strand:- start:178 stop:591 length:414 start_codon:yes stop_codon:yes gene_type:complete
MSEKYNISTCIYCGYIGKERHHYKESVANSGKKRSYHVDDVLPTCRECNSLLGSLNPDYIECCYLLHNKVSHRHKKLLAMPGWEREELDRISGHLRRTTKSYLSRKKIHLERLNQLWNNAQSSMTYNEIRDIVRFGG